MTQLIHMIYASISTTSFDDNQLDSLLETARTNNTALDITGMLLYCDGSFFQVIEGHTSTIHQLFESLKKDSRHKGIVTIIEEPILERAFSDWSMGFAKASKEQIATLSDMNDFFNQGQCLVNIKAGRAKKILSAFAMGRWHLS